ncbi:hypothetical protein LOTGIDRAFT_230579 [Lottia gigantea]|uniref:Uncharacterized protein n=1 Tax=Lottia gigantea TaxID=225164 RepID=V4B433_LOTGI|nr:hypothetical protein LOTGIDRAFT_230579 [Lottia gigantea]ESP02191.1 hypothetical protein LOTGIDRAFT_230579 [Lottia gigantea]
MTNFNKIYDGMNIGGLTNVHSTIPENASVSDVMYNYPVTVENQPSRPNGNVLQPRISRIPNSAHQKLDVWKFPNSEIKQPTREEFYQSYDPKIGLHTAAVLGGILVWLIIYLVYRTKCKKVIIRFFKGLSERRKEKKRASFHMQNKQSTVRMGADTPSIIMTSDKQEITSNHVSINVQTSNAKDIDQTEITVPTDLELQEVPTVLQKPPRVKTDIKKATAQWVKEQPLSIQSLQELPSSCVTAFTSDYSQLKLPNSCPPIRDELIHKSSFGLSADWNKSLPSISHHLEASLSSYSDKGPASNSSSQNKVLKATDDHSVDKANLNKRLLPKLTITIPDSISTDATELTLNDSLVPIPVTPTVKIQNYTSKRSAHSPSLHRLNSDDSISSNSSDEPLLSDSMTQSVDCWHDNNSKQTWPLNEKVKCTGNDVNSVNIRLLNDKETVL